jgi:hypothetical protein
MEVEIVRIVAKGTPAELAESGWAGKDIYRLTGQALVDKAQANGTSPVDPHLDQQLVELCRSVLQRGRFGPKVRATLLACDAAGETGLLPSELAEAIGVSQKALGTGVFAGFGNAISATPDVKTAFANGLSTDKYVATRLFFTFPIDPQGLWRYVLRPEARAALRAEGFVAD